MAEQIEMTKVAKAAENLRQYLTVVGRNSLRELGKALSRLKETNSGKKSGDTNG